jgi:hypothetical protein
LAVFSFFKKGLPAWDFEKAIVSSTFMVAFIKGLINSASIFPPDRFYLKALTVPSPFSMHNAHIFSPSCAKIIFRAFLKSLFGIYDSTHKQGRQEHLSSCMIYTFL